MIPRDISRYEPDDKQSHDGDKLDQKDQDDLDCETARDGIDRGGVIECVHDAVDTTCPDE